MKTKKLLSLPNGFGNDSTTVSAPETDVRLRVLEDKLESVSKAQEALILTTCLALALVLLVVFLVSKGVG